MLPFKFLLLWHKYFCFEKMNFHFLSIFIPSQWCFSFLILLLFSFFVLFCYFQLFHFRFFFVSCFAASFYGFLFHSFVLCTENIVISCFIAAYASQHIFNDLYDVCVVKKLPILRFFFHFWALQWTMTIHKK